jgi:hypothetical protein
MKRILLSLLSLAFLISIHAQYQGLVAGKNFNIIGPPTFKHAMTGLSTRNALVATFYCNIKNDTLFFYETIAGEKKLSGINLFPIPIAGINKTSIRIESYKYEGYTPSKCFALYFTLKPGYQVMRTYYRLESNDTLTDEWTDTKLYFASRVMAEEFQKKYLK